MATSSVYEQRRLSADGQGDGWVTLYNMIGITVDSTGWIYDVNSVPVGIAIGEVDVPNKKVKLLHSVGGPIFNASAYKVSEGATLNIPTSHVDDALPTPTDTITQIRVLENGVMKAVVDAIDFQGMAGVNVDHTTVTVVAASIEGPQGEQGEQGLQGVQGPPGPSTLLEQGIWVGTVPPPEPVSYPYWVRDGIGQWGWFDLNGIPGAGDVPVDPPSASMGITPGVANANWGGYVNAIAVSCSLTAGTPTLFISRSAELFPQAASMALTGGVADTRVTAHQDITAIAASMALTGGVADVFETDYQFVTGVAASMAVTPGVAVTTKTDDAVIFGVAASSALTSGTADVFLSDNKQITGVAASMAITAGLAIYEMVTPTPISYVGAGTAYFTLDSQDGVVPVDVPAGLTGDLMILVFSSNAGVTGVEANWTYDQGLYYRFRPNDGYTSVGVTTATDENGPYAVGCRVFVWRNVHAATPFDIALTAAAKTGNVWTGTSLAGASPQSMALCFGLLNTAATTLDGVGGSVDTSVVVNGSGQTIVMAYDVDHNGETAAPTIDWATATSRAGNMFTTALRRA